LSKGRRGNINPAANQRVQYSAYNTSSLSPYVGSNVAGSPVGSSSSGRPNSVSTMSASTPGSQFANTSNGTGGASSGGATFTFAEDPKYSHKRASKSTNYDSDGSAYTSSGETSDGEFITAFDRSPPSFGEELLEESGGIFPVGRSSQQGVGQNNVSLNSDLNSNGIEEDDNYGDPPVMTLDEEDLVENIAGGIMNSFSGSVFGIGNANSGDDGFGSVVVNKGSVDDGFGYGDWFAFDTFDEQEQQQTKALQSRSGEWDTHDSQERNSKNPRLVSPSPSDRKKQQLPTSGSSQIANDDFAAWGMPLSASKGDEREDVFGANNFFSDGFSDGFNIESGEKKVDSFFGDEWMDVNTKNTGEADAWGTSFALNEEKKDDSSSATPRHTQKDPASFSPQDPVAVTPTPSKTKTDSETHPLKQPMRDNREVVVSFEDFDGINASSSPLSSTRPKLEIDRKVSHGGTLSRPQQQQQRGHRRVPSNGSSNSQQQRNLTRRKGGGSVGSNSSAVDQILEQYRQKRLAKQGGGSVKSATQLGTASHLPPNINHRRDRSNESISKIISNLETSVAAKNTASSNGSRVQQQQHRNPAGTAQPQPGRSSPQSSMTGHSRGGLSYQPNINAAVNQISERLRAHRGFNESSDPNDADQFLLANIAATIGPRGVAPDMESLSGRSQRSHRSHNRRPNRSPQGRTDGSVASHTSRNSFRSYQTNRSALSHMSKESQSVAADLFRLEAQLASVSKQPELASPVQSKKSLSSHVVDNLLASTSDMSVRSNSNTIGAEPIPRPSPVKVLAPPGKLGILLANKAGQNGPTHVSAVRSESVLAGKVHVGDRFASIDGEDVSRMNSKEITTIMARKSDFEREIVFVPLQSTKSNAEWI